MNKLDNTQINALLILECYGKVLLDNIEDLEHEDLQGAIEQLKYLEHYADRTGGLWVTDRPDLLNKKDKEKYFFELECEGFDDSFKGLFPISLDKEQS